MYKLFFRVVLRHRSQNQSPKAVIIRTLYKPAIRTTKPDERDLRDLRHAALKSSVSDLGNPPPKPRKIKRNPIPRRTSTGIAPVQQSLVFPYKPLPLVTHIPSSTLSYYWDTNPPTSKQLRRAELFFLKHPPSIVYSAIKFKTVRFTSAPEVAFLGRSNVGKSSLLNAVMGAKVCRTSVNPGRTRSMNFFAVGGEDGMGNPGKLLVLDMPGYGKGSREEWGKEIEKYLLNRKELRRVFLLISPEHGLKSSDLTMLSMLRRNGIPHQVILPKVDRILLRGRKTPTEAQMLTYTSTLKTVVEEIREKIQPKFDDGPAALGEILTCSAEKSNGSGERLGINNVRWAILAATGLGQNEMNLETQDISDSIAESSIAAA